LTRHTYDEGRVPGAVNAEIDTERLKLCPITEADAADLFPVLKDPRLYRFTGDSPPPSVVALRHRYRQLSGRVSPEGSELWLNWCIRLRADRRAIGYVQASVRTSDAEIAWVVGIPWQTQGYAKEVVRRLVEWLRDELEVGKLTACIRAGHVASEAVASSAGLRPSADQIEGETVWTLTLTEY
jgi:RimJ/RimL family protein N-acetyltransferase